MFLLRAVRTRSFVTHICMFLQEVQFLASDRVVAPPEFASYYSGTYNCCLVAVTHVPHTCAVVMASAQLWMAAISLELYLSFEAYLFLPSAYP